MAQPTQNSYAVAFAQEIVAFDSDLKGLLARALAIQEKQANRNYAANLQAMPTYVLNADGTQGTTDGSPNQANPIVGLNVSFYNLDNFRTTVLDALVACLTGGAVATLDRRTAMDQLLP